MENKEKINKLINFYDRKKRMPSFSEMQKLFGFKSKNSVTKLINRLSEEGIVRKDPKGKLLPTGYFTEIPMLGTVEAGFPSPAEEELSDTMDLDEYLIPNREATFIVKAHGDSMIDAGIIDGDIILVDRSKTPRDGDIVIAAIDDGYTVKHLRKNGSKVWLEPANKKYKPIYPTDTLRIVAVGVAVVRKYRL